MAFREWSPEQYEFFQEEAWRSIYNEIPSVPYLDEESDEQARDLFEKGWLTFGEYTEEEIDNFRDQFLDIVYMPENLFRSLGFWREYRELYAEVDTG
jgi:DNA-dependent RNA polymerase auxiliary subunit epsilon